MKSITVFCGASTGQDDDFIIQAGALGRKLAQETISLVYGGAKIGLMGAVADGALSEGGTVIGVLPEFLKSREIAHDKLSELILVDTMHARKTKMNELCDGVIALPGGFGTLEELFEMLTWRQLGLHKKPIALLNVNGYYKELIHLLDSMVEKGLLKKVDREMLLVSDDISELIDQMKAYHGPDVGQWISEDTV